MKYKARFIIPNTTAEKCGISLTKTYDVFVETFEIESNPNSVHNYVVIKSSSLEKEWLIEIRRILFSETFLSLSGWLTHDPQGESTLCRGGIELRQF